MDKELAQRVKNLTFSTMTSPIEVKDIEGLLAERGTSQGKINKALTDQGQKTLTEEQLAGSIIRFVASDATPDRYGDVVNPKGWDFSEFRNNPVFLSQHNSRELPIGISLKETITEKSANEGIPKELQGQLVMDIFFHGITKESREMLALYQAGMMKAVSVGFLPLEIRTFTDEADRKALGLGQWGELFERQKLLELSAVTIPANPSAVMIENSLEKSILEKLTTKLTDLFNSKFATPNQIKDLQSKLDDVFGKVDLINNRKSAEELIKTKSVDESEMDNQILSVFKLS